MRYLFLIIYLFFFAIIPTHLFSQETMADDPLLERYIQESEKLKEKFTPIYNRLEAQAWVQEKNAKYRDAEKWRQEYEQPLFEAAKSAMKRVVGSDDYLEMWENRIPERITATLKCKEEFRSYYTDIDFIIKWDTKQKPLFAPYTFAIVHAKQAELTSGILYQEITSPGGMMGMGTVSRPMKFPPIVSLSENSYDPSWHIMAIYSFKNDRARDLLFEMVARSDEEQDFLADWAVYYLPFFPNSGELLPKIKFLLKEEITKAQRDQPYLSKTLFHENGELIDSSLKQFREKISGSLPKSIFYKIQRLLALKKALEFNEKIPAEEREHFDIFRRELAISWSLSSKRRATAPRMSATLRKGDEHFEIYFREYAMLIVISDITYDWEDDGDHYPYTLENPLWQKRKAFYERELAHPRPIYTENQMEYLKTKIKGLEL